MKPKKKVKNCVETLKVLSYNTFVVVDLFYEQDLMPSMKI
jgi:hypothetical protein